MSTPRSAIALLVSDDDSQEVVQPTLVLNAGLVSVATVILTDAEIRALPTPYVILPPSEIVNYGSLPTSLPKVISASVVIDTLAGAYDPGCQLFLSCGSPADSSIGQSVKLNGAAGYNATGISTNEEKRMFSFLLAENVEAQGVLDNAIVLTSDGAPIGGHPSNTLKITVYYATVAT